MSAPVLLLPGLLCDETVWFGQREALAGQWDVWTLGFFRQDSIASMAQAVLAAAPPRFAVAGHSMGARVALEMARVAPGRVERLALLDTGTHALRAGETEKRRALVDLARREGMAALAEQWLPPMVHPGRLADGALMGALRAMVGRASPDLFAGQVEALLGRPDAAPVLPNLRCPVLIGVGRQDAWSPPDQHRAMSEAVPHAALVVFEDSGHMAPMEASEAVGRALRDWLAMPLRARN